MSNSEAVQDVSAPVPQGRYVPAVYANGTVRTAGMTPRRDGVLVLTGRVGAEVSVEDARSAAALAVGNALAAVRSALPAGRGFRPVEMVVYVATAPGFTALSTVADGASEVIERELGPENLPARSAIGVHTLPGDAPVEIALTAAVS
ncbi:RidA family protein [Rhodococcus sp. Z13]|uniref:RidA family protein n=1 Tax=Rhodococcus sacchari TaxID=2962047 RepID=A0ACD4DGS1_9NOCA|nr:RidA family protein [Rhodococcus sp. Z13]UYP19265.1 RidA family protein [Rhodococcus sp. Z13]